MADQIVHGGQDWKGLPNFVEDFSVTTNALGCPIEALQSAIDCIPTIQHYPEIHCEPAWSHLASFMQLDSFDATFKLRLVLGNGASELIDILIRLFNAEKLRPGPFRVQYKEYERSGLLHGCAIADTLDKSARLLCIVNPCNPTGKFLDVYNLKKFIEDNCTNDTTVLVDESMIFWIGENWKESSLISEWKWIDKMLDSQNIRVFVIHSWTKVWCCPGIRFGSVLAPTVEFANQIRRYQNPWPVNCIAIAFIDRAILDRQYLEDTWKLTRIWREMMYSAIKRLRPQWEVFGEKWISFLWIDVLEQRVALDLFYKCRENGVPIRWGGDGYQCPTFIRIAVRRPEKADVLLKILTE